MNSSDEAAATARAPTQRVGVLAELPALLRELRVDPGRVLAAAGLEPTVFDHIENRIPVDAIDGLFDACVEHTGCEHFGLLVGQRAHLSHLGVMSELMESAPTVGDALRSFSAVQHLNSDMGVAFVLEDGDLASLGFVIYRTDLRRPGQVYDVALTLACSIMRSLCRLHWTAREVVLARPAPRDVTPYRRCFGPHVRFDQAYSAVRFSSRWLTQPSPHADPKRHQALLEAIQARDVVDLVPKLHRALRVLLIRGSSSGDSLAQLLSLHRRTLNRRLKGQGTTFQKLLDEVRLDVARQLLLSTRTPIDEIASALCYADVSAFMHAFRRWTGTTPALFRHEHSARQEGLKRPMPASV
jgi:AraC-like DNA-binding protein